MNKIDELLKIKELLDSGIISEKEFQEQKKDLLYVSENVNRENNTLNSTSSKGETISVISQKSNTLSPSNSKPKSPSNQVKLVLGILGVIIAIAVIYFSVNKKQLETPVDITDSTSIENTDVLQKSESIDDDDWKLEKSSKITFSNSSEYFVEMSSKKHEYSDQKFKLSIYKIENGKNQLLWESEDNQGFAFQSLEILNTNKTAIIAGVYNLGGAHGLNNYYVVSLSESGVINPVNIIEQDGYIEKSYNSLIIVEANQRIIFKVTNNEIIRSIETKDSMVSEDSIKAYFKVENDEIIGTNDSIKIKVGETISFIPLDEFSSQLFNSGDIHLFTDAWDTNTWENKLSLGESNRIKSGNSYTFDSEGTFHFVLCNWRTCNGEQPPTFTVYVE
jgi:hypothetical protein